ncbi:MAG: hypothetical protein H6667_18070 [Ardenticatenaceae bacterium]|nr:hypothetical protein [Ardenticatenaceae bacterium]
MLTLYQPGTEEAVAGISCWRCTYSVHGEGFALVLWCNPLAVGIPDLPPIAVFVDNTAMGRMVMTRFNQYFIGYKGRGLENAEPQQARFVQQFDGQRLHRITCVAHEWSIEVQWREVLDAALESFDNHSGSERFDVTTVICPCRDGAIIVNGTPLIGEVRVPEGEKLSSAFLALSETWIARE